MNYVGKFIYRKNGRPFSNGEKKVKVIKEIGSQLWLSSGKYIYKQSAITEEEWNMEHTRPKKHPWFRSTI